MKIKKDNKYSNYLLILLLLVLLGVIGYKIFENYNIKHIIFEEQEVERVKVEISEMEKFYKINFTDEDDMVKALTVRNKLREYVDTNDQGLKGNVHFTIYDEDGRENYDEFDSIYIEDYVWELLDLDSAKKQYIDELNINPEDVKKITFENPYTKEKFEISNTEEEVSGYSGLELVDSLVLALKKDIMSNPYVFNDDKLEFSMTINAEKKYELLVLKNYENVLGIINQVLPEITLQMDDLSKVAITKENNTVEITDEEFQEAKDAIYDVIGTFVPYTDVDSEIQIQFTFKDELEIKDLFGSIHKDDVTENIYDLFE